MCNHLKEIYKKKYRKFICKLNISEKLKIELFDEKFIEANPPYYLYYPKLFTSYFNLGSKMDEDVNQVCIAGYLYYHSVILIDSLIDENKINYLPKINLLQEESIKILTAVFNRDSLFWNDWNVSRKEYFQAVEIEKELLSKKVVTKSKYLKLADFKSSFGKIAISAIYELNGRKQTQVYRKLISSHKLFSVGFQLFDDLTDFDEDFNKQFNWAIYKMLKKRPGLKKELLNKYLYIDGVGQNIMKNAVHYLNEATIKLVGLNYKSNDLWVNLINNTKYDVESNLDITTGYIEVLKKRISLSKELDYKNTIKINDDKINDNTIQKGLEFIQKDFNHNFTDLKHIMYLSHREGFSSGDNIHVGDIFQRALVADCLLDVQKKYKIDLEKYINHEIDYFIKNTTKDKIWSYFKTVQEILADADDLGQILQFFYRANKIDLIKQETSKAINILLNDRYHEDGGIETWIIPNKDKTDNQKIQEHFNETKWGKGPDVEVMANFLYSIVMCDLKKYGDKILISINYLITKQNQVGYWQSRWYYGKYYGTFVCLRLLTHLNSKNYDFSIQNALKFLCATQNKDGGWGTSKNSDPLNTSYAILTLKLYKFMFKNEILDGINYLEKNQNQSGSWNAVDFIEPKSYQPYKSEVLTTSIVLKALTN